MCCTASRAPSSVSVDNIVGTGAFFIIRQLSPQNAGKLILGHVGPCQDAGALCVRINRHHRHGIQPGISVNFKEKRDVQQEDRIIVGCDVIAPVSGNQRMNDPFQRREDKRVGRDRVLQKRARDGPVHHHIRQDLLYRGDSGATGRIKPMHCGIRIPNGHAHVHEHLGGRGLAHPDGSGKSQKKAHAITALRRSSSTSGRRPNHRSNPGTP